MKSHRILSVLMAFAFASATAYAAAPNASPVRNADVSIPNWDAPPTWTLPTATPDPDAAEQDASAAAMSGPRSMRQPQILVSPTPLEFVPITPCRIVDTRGNGQTGAFGTPQLAANTSRTIPVPIHPTCTGIPSTAGAYSLNLAVTNTGSGAYGYLQAWPTGQAQPTASNLNYPGPGATLANAAVVPAGTSGSIDIFSGNASADVIIDINGYYGPAGSLPNGSVQNSFTKTAGVDRFYNVTVMLPTGGACLVMSTAQFFFGANPITPGPYYRIAIKRGAVDFDDGIHGNYFQAAGGLTSIELTRHHIFTLNPGVATQFGCSLSGTADLNWQTTLYCKTTYLCF